MIVYIIRWFKRCILLCLYNKKGYVCIAGKEGGGVVVVYDDESDSDNEI